MSLKVSVAMATYNGAAYLPAQLASLLEQTLLPIEIVICDDCSIDGTRAFLAEMQQQYGSLTQVYYNDTRMGYVANFSKAISLCHGDIIALCDQDDVWYQTKLKRIVGALEAMPSAAIAISNADIVDASLQRSGRLLYSVPIMQNLGGERFPTGLLQGVGVNGCTLAFRSSFLRHVLPAAPFGWGHDHWIALLLLTCGPAAVITEATMAYRRHGKNAGNNPRLEPSLPRRALLTLRAKTRHVSVGDYEAYADRWDFFLERMDEISSAPGLSVDQRRLTEAATAVHNLRAFAHERTAIRKQTRYRRIKTIFSHFRAGDYCRQANGFGAILKDLLA